MHKKENVLWIRNYTRIKNGLRPFYYIDCTHKQHCKDFIKYLYNDCNIYLDRKYKLAQETIGAQ